MGKILDEPKFPVIDRAPSVSRTVSNFNLTDWGTWAGVAAVSYPLGYLAGGAASPAFSRVSGAMARPSAAMGAALGALAGFMLAYQNSSGRLMGLSPNAAEVAAAGDALRR